MQHKFTAIVTLLLVASCMSLSSKNKLSPFEAGLLPENSIMKRLNNIFIQLRNIDDSTSNVKTLEQFVNVIKGLFDDLDADQKKHDEVLERMNQQCADEKTFRDKEVEDAKKALNDAASSQKVCQGKLDTATQLKKETENLLQDERTKKEQRSQLREQEHKIYLDTKSQYEDAIAFLKEFILRVKSKLTQGAPQPAFVEFSESLLRHTAGLKRLDAAVPVLVMLAQYTSAQAGNYQEFNGSQAAATLQEKLDALLKTLETDLNKIIEVENQRVADFNAFLVAVNKNIDDLEKSIVDLNAQIKNMSECVAREGAIIADASAKETRNADLRAKAAKMCIEFAKEVMEATKARKTEMAVIEEILALLKIRFGKVPQNLINYMETIKIKFAEYENRTKFIVVKYYERAALVEDALGKDIVADTKNYADNKKF